MTTFEFIRYSLIVLSILGAVLYLYMAFRNKAQISVDFFGLKKKITLRHMILICFLDGIVLGVIVGFLVFWVRF